jgi:hypothetical protein
MSDYERHTVLPTREVFQRAAEVLTTRGDLKQSRHSHHGVTYSGAEGTVTLDVHRHGAATVVTARTNQLRTSKLDTVVRYLMNQLPYQPGDPGRE